MILLVLTIHFHKIYGALCCLGHFYFFPHDVWMTQQAFLVTVRNKKRVGYTYELTVKVKGTTFLL